MLRRRMAESESDAVCSGSLLVVRPTRKSWRRRRALRGRSPAPTLGYTRNAGQRGRNSVDLRRARLSLESVSAVYRTTAAYAVAVVVHQRITAAVKDAGMFLLKKRTGKNGSQYARKQHSRSIQRPPRWIGDSEVLDPYGVDPDLPEECQCIGREYFARSPGSDIWVHFHDLPEETRDALWERHEFEVGVSFGS